MPSVSRPGAHLAFSTSTQSLRVWLFSLDNSRRLASRPPTAVTPAEVDAMRPALSPDGRSLAYIGQRRGVCREKRLSVISVDDPTSEITLRIVGRDLPENIWRPVWSPDGKKIAYSYRRRLSEKPPIYSSSVRWVELTSQQDSAITSASVSSRRRVENPWGWSSDGKWLFTSGDRYYKAGMGLVRLPVSGAPFAERSAQAVFSSSTHALWNTTESPNGRWICANMTTFSDVDSAALYVLPVQGGEPKPLLPDQAWADLPLWSADGRIVYFLSRRGDTFDVWGVEFDPLLGRAIGAPYKITDLRSPDAQIAGLDRDCAFSIVGDRLALPLLAMKGSIWMLH